MGDIEKKARNEGNILGELPKDIAVDMRFFSWTMRSLYAENAVGTNHLAAVKFRKLRDDTRNDAMVYLKGILPVSTKFVSSISEYFEYYVALDYNEWCEMLPEILEKTTAYKQLCANLLKMHEDILVPLVRRGDDAIILVTEFKDLKEKYEEEKKALARNPVVRLLVSPLLPDEFFGSPSITVKDCLIPALEHFRNGTRKAAGFFCVMEQELVKFEGQTDKATKNPKKLYYKIMNKQVESMKSICQSFYAVLPNVRTDFLAIPTQGTDQNYVDRWLANQKKIIEENTKAQKLVKMLVKSITMGDIEKKTRDEGNILREVLKDIAVDMRFLSWTMRSLYAENAVGTNHLAAVKFRKLRDDTRNDAMVYLKGILPVSTKFVSSISEYFEYYVALDYNEWCEMLPEILEKTTGYKQLCANLLKMHEDILVPLVRRGDDAIILVTEFKDLKEKYEEEKKALARNPVVRLLVSPLLPDEFFGFPSITVKDCLIPALEHFRDGTRKAARFFSVMEQELMKFEDRAKKEQENPRKLYYKLMNKEVESMKSICQCFYAVLPDVRTDFLAIPTQGTDQNYVDRWLANQKKIIEENTKVPKLVKMLVKSITG